MSISVWDASGEGSLSNRGSFNTSNPSSERRASHSEGMRQSVIAKVFLIFKNLAEIIKVYKKIRL
jgi:hypothetical protein